MVKPFLDVFKDVTAKASKVKKQNYQEYGDIPVVDQGKKQFGGYADKLHKVCGIQLPAIVFGDHTRVFKYIEEDFALGADGVKLLQPKVESNSKYLYWYLTQLQLENAGYSRHFKYLKETHIPLPPLKTQKHIASVLEKADQLRKDCQRLEQELNQLAQSVFIEMFGDPVTNPKGWETENLNLIANIQIGPFGTQLHKEDYISNGIPLINPTHLKQNKIIPNKDLTLSEEKYNELTQYHLKKNDIIMGRRGEMGRTAIIDEESDGWFCGTGSLYIRLYSKNVLPAFLNDILSSHSMKKWLEDQSLGATMPNLNKKILHSIKIPIPSLELQQKYCQILEFIETQKGNNKKQRGEQNNLFNTLSQKAFKGELKAPA